MVQRFGGGQKVEQQRGQSRLLQDRGDESIARAVATASAAMSKEDGPIDARGDVSRPPSAIAPAGIRTSFSRPEGDRRGRPPLGGRRSPDRERSAGAGRSLRRLSSEKSLDTTLRRQRRVRGLEAPGRHTRSRARGAAIRDATGTASTIRAAPSARVTHGMRRGPTNQWRCRRRPRWHSGPATSSPWPRPSRYKAAWRSSSGRSRVRPLPARRGARPADPEHVGVLDSTPPSPIAPMASSG